MTAVASGSRTSPVRRPKPDSATAMRLLIAQVCDAIPFDLPAAQLCIGECDGCSLKLLEFLASELYGWEARLDAGERPGLKELSRLARPAARSMRCSPATGWYSLRRSHQRSIADSGSGPSDRQLSALQDTLPQALEHLEGDSLWYRQRLPWA